MTNINFLQGLKANLPTNAVEGALLFTTDTGELFRGNGDETPITPYGSVLYGYADLADLQTKNPAIQGKLYLTNAGQIYTYNGVSYSVLEMSSESIGFDGGDTGLEAETVQDAIKEVDNKVTEAEEAINQLEADAGKVKINSADTLGYVADKLHATLVFEDGVVKVKGIDGVNLTPAQIQEYLGGTKGNIQNQVDDIVGNIEAIASGMSYVGTVVGEAGLAAISNATNGSLAVVAEDGESNKLYVYNANAAEPKWQSLGKFEFAENFIDLKGTPAAYDNGKVLKSTTNGTVFGTIDYSELTGTADVTNQEVEDAVAKKHIHANAAQLDKIGEDVDGNMTYNGQRLSPQWQTFEF